MKYVATINVPGYMPMDDEPPVFDTVTEAWEYLARERTDAEDEAIEGGEGEGYSACKNTLDTLAGTSSWSDFANAGLDFDGTGSVTGPTPGYDGEHDLGLAYTVAWVEPQYTEEEKKAMLAATRARLEEQPRKVVRFYSDDRPSEVIKRGLTLEQAQAHCNDPASRGDDWFDGYEVDDLS